MLLNISIMVNLAKEQFYCFNIRQSFVSFLIDCDMPPVVRTLAALTLPFSSAFFPPANSHSSF